MVHEPRTCVMPAGRYAIVPFIWKCLSEFNVGAFRTLDVRLFQMLELLLCKYHLLDFPWALGTLRSFQVALLVS